MKKLVIYYSFDGNTRLIAEKIAAVIDAEIMELKTRTELAPKGLMKFFIGGKAAVKQERPPLLPLEKDVRQYDVIFIGTPVWAFTYTPPLRTFFAENELSGKNIALFCCHGGGKGKVFTAMKEALSGNRFLGEMDFKEPLRYETDLNVLKAKDWAVNILSIINSAYKGSNH
jgi:flavodoxin